MLFNKVGGGAEKVKINGKKVDNRLDLETDFAIKQLAYSGGLYISPLCAMYNPLLGKYLVLDNYKKRAFLLNPSGFQEEVNRWKEISTPPLNSTFIFFKDDEVIFIDSTNKFYKADIKEDGNAIYTNISNAFSEEFGRFWYDEETKELFGESHSGDFKKFDFNSKTWTETATYNRGLISRIGVIRNKKIIILESKSVVEFDGKTFTEKKDILNVEVALSSKTRAGVLNGKIHIFSSLKIDNVQHSNIHAVETEEYKFKRLRDINGLGISSSYGYNNCSDNNNKLALLCFGNDREHNIEITEIYREREV